MPNTSNMVGISPEMLQDIISNAVAAARQPASVVQSPSSKPENPKRPVITSSMTLEKWSYFLTKWSRYKTMTKIRNEELVCQLLECCEEDLQLGLHRSVGACISDKPETEVLACIKKYAVPTQNTLISRNILRGMSQDKDEDIQHFAARIKGQAEMCNYTVSCTKPDCDTLISYADAEVKDQICKGLADQEIQQDILSHKDQSLSLEEMISYVASKESGKRCHTELSSNKFSLSKISTYQKNKFTSRNPPPHELKART